MAKISGDERREVAAWLRMQVGEEECIDYAVFRIINDVLGVNGAWGAKAAHILADLIDPTCHNQHPRASDGCFCCSECLFLYEPTDLSACWNSFLHCPRCGARVVSGDGE